MNVRMPALFVGHGDPMLALRHDDITEALTRVGRNIRDEFGTPKAILAISAHRFTRGTYVVADEHPEQIRDMYGFPPELYDLDYPVSGDAELARTVMGIEDLHAQPDTDWGIDHGVWTPLVHLFPEADIPVVEMSVDENLGARESYQAGAHLSFLRDQGYLILGSGNVVHNLRRVNWKMPGGSEQARAFDDFIAQAVIKRNDDQVIDFEACEHAAYAVPTPDHFLPLLYVLGASQKEAPEVFNRVCQLSALSMTSYLFKG